MTVAQGWFYGEAQLSKYTGFDKRKFREWRAHGLMYYADTHTGRYRRLYKKEDVDAFLSEYYKTEHVVIGGSGRRRKTDKSMVI
jgi:hypothetical protein